MNNNLIYNPKRRLLTITMLIVFLFVAVLLKLLFVMVIQSEVLQTRAAEQWYRDLPLVARRGGIYDRNGITIADTSTRYTVYVRPNAVKDSVAVAQILSKHIGVDYDKIYAKIEKGGASEITVAKKIDKQKMLAIIAQNLDGIYFSEDSFRYYPYGDFMTQVLGFTNIDLKGQSGLEAYYNTYLTGINGKVLSEADLIGRALEDGTRYYLPSISGYNITLTVDFYIQSIVENAVRKAAAAHSAKRVSCLVINPTTGEILAMAETPSYDLNDIPRDDLESLFAYSKNTMVSSVYEPGSTFKILTSAIALEEDVFSDSHTFFCAGSRIIDGQKIKCWKTKGHGSQTFIEGVCNSCNCVFMDCAIATGKTKFYDYLRKFGINVKTGIDVSGETSGLMLKESLVKNVDLARIGFGQAIALTPIELAVAAAAAVNGGEVLTPYIMQSIIAADGTNIATNAKTVRNNAISAGTSKELRDILYEVVKRGSGKGCYIAGYNIGGKTGTAQKYENGLIAQGKYYSSFIGFEMYEGAEALVLFLVDEPVGVYYGSIVAAPYVKEIFSGIFDYYNIAPVYTGEESAIIGEPFVLEDYYGMSVAKAVNKLRNLGLYVEVSGEGDYVTGQLPSYGATVNKTNTVLLYCG